MNRPTKRCPNCNYVLPKHEVEICPACGHKILLPPPPPPPPPPPDKPHYGGFWIRLAAAIIDCVVVQILILPVFIPLRIGLEFVSDAIQSQTGGVGEIALMQNTVLLMVGYAIYEAVLESSGTQATPGKMLFHLKVTNLDGNRISFARALGRHSAKYVSLLTLLIGYLIAGFTARKQALHDLITGTLVQRTQLTGTRRPSAVIRELIAKLRAAYHLF